MDKKRVRMGYVILHYNSIADTRACVESIQRMPSFGDSRVVIVDNASPNGTGRALADQYRGDAHIEVLLNDTNGGFSAGNNLGYGRLRETCDADFITVCNNDVVFPEPDYCEKVEQAYAARPFHVLGPDIYNPGLGIHQSPLGDAAPSAMAARRTILLNGLAERCFPLFWALFGRRTLASFRERGDSVKNYGAPAENVPLMGACLVFSRDYVALRREAFSPVTFLYYEEFLLYNYCARNGLRMVYRPEIRIIHNEGRATSTLSKNEREKLRRLVHNTRLAAQVYLRDLVGR